MGLPSLKKEAKPPRLLAQIKAIRVAERTLRNIQFGNYDNDGEVVTDEAEANAISSDIIGHPGWHLPVIDIDLPIRAIPSTRKGHFHLYIDVPMETDDFLKLLNVMVEVGLVQEGYYLGAERRGHADVRLPHIKKEEGTVT